MTPSRMVWEHKVFYLSGSASNNGTPMFTSMYYDNRSSRWAIHDKVHHRHDGKEQVDDRPGDDGHLPGLTLLGFRSKPLVESDSL